VADQAPVSSTPFGAEAPESDYQRIGGGRAVSAVVDRFYESVLGDPQLVPYFVETREQIRPRLAVQRRGATRPVVPRRSDAVEPL
jgi:hypothetical protein